MAAREQSVPSPIARAAIYSYADFQSRHALLRHDATGAIARRKHLWAMRLLMRAARAELENPS